MISKKNDVPLFWQIIVPISVILSLITFNVQFKLLPIEKVIFWNKGDTTTSNYNLTMSNSTANVVIGTIIGSNNTLTWVTPPQIPITTQCTDAFFTQALYVTNNNKYNMHNYIYHDEFGNTIFLKNFPYNTSIRYAVCNGDLTSCFINSSFVLENDKNYPPCFEAQNGLKKDGYALYNVTLTDYAKANLDKCIDLINNSTIQAFMRDVLLVKG